MSFHRLRTRNTKVLPSGGQNQSHSILGHVTRMLAEHKRVALRYKTPQAQCRVRQHPRRKTLPMPTQLDHNLECAVWCSVACSCWSTSAEYRRIAPCEDHRWIIHGRSMDNVLSVINRSDHRRHNSPCNFQHPEHPLFRKMTGTGNLIRIARSSGSGYRSSKTNIGKSSLDWLSSRTSVKRRVV